MSKSQDEGTDKDDKADLLAEDAENQSYDDAKNNPNEFGETGPRDGVGDWGGPAGEYFTGQYPPPAVPNNGDSSGGGVRVSTEALKLFAANIRSLLPTLKVALEQIDTIKIAPGIFYDAYQLQVKIVNDGQGQAIQPTTRDFLVKAIDAITVVADELDRLASAYATAEELNAATGQDLNEYIANAKTEVGKAVGGAVGATA